MTAQRIGVMFDRARPPEELIDFARDLERLGVDELWVVEDLGWGGAIASAATALAVTERIVVGIGIVPAPLRNPALLAMELATLERLHPGRLIAGIGHGVSEWMAKVGEAVDSPLTLLEETFVGVRALLDGGLGPIVGPLRRARRYRSGPSAGHRPTAAGGRDETQVAPAVRPGGGRHDPRRGNRPGGGVGGNSDHRSAKSP